MIELFVESFNNTPPQQPASARFGAEGGTVGRSPDNRLVLHDPKRYVSRIQASIRCAGGTYFISNVSEANPIHVNGQELDYGQEQVLVPGDRIQIGLFMVVARAVPGIGAAPPPAPLIPGDFDPFAAPAQMPPSHDPLAALGTAEVSLQSLTSTPAVDETFGLSASHPNAAIDPLLQATPPAGAAQSPLMQDPLFTGPDRNAVDPLALFGGAPAAEDPLFAGLGAPIQDQTSELRGYFKPPQPVAQPMRSPAPPEMPRAIPAEAFAQPVAPPLEPTLAPALHAAQVDDGAQAVREALAPTHALPVNPPLATGPLGILDALEGGAGAPVAVPHDVPPLVQRAEPVRKAEAATIPGAGASVSAPPTSAQGLPAASAPQASGDLLAAFLAGAGLESMDVPGGLTPELMSKIGAILRSATEGAVELMSTRALTKREVKADVTMIVPRANNPMKFLPNGQSVLMQMLGTRMPGFMGPVEAMQDTFRDLKTHQIGMIAGMRAALADVLRRFDPEQIEDQAAERGWMDAVLPANRKAKLWDLYEKRFAEIWEAAQDDSHTLFGKAFVEAYEAEIDRVLSEAESK